MKIGIFWHEHFLLCISILIVFTGSEQDIQPCFAMENTFLFYHKAQIVYQILSFLKFKITLAMRKSVKLKQRIFLPKSILVFTCRKYSHPSWLELTLTQTLQYIYLSTMAGFVMNFLLWRLRFYFIKKQKLSINYCCC